VCMEGELVDEAGDEAMPTIKIGGSSRVAGLRLIIDAGVESHRGGGDVVDRF